VWPIRGGTTFECRECDHQTSLTSGTLLEKTHKPLKMWFRAVFEISTRRTGISAKDLQRIMGFGSYKDGRVRWPTPRPTIRRHSGASPTDRSRPTHAW
jgi:hypothetical protein